MPKKMMKKLARSTGGDIGSKVGQRAEDELVKFYNSLGLARGGMARGGIPHAGVGSDVGSKIGNAIEDWATNLWHSLGFARGGMAGYGGMDAMHNGSNPMPRDVMMKTKAFLKRLPHAGVGADMGSKLGNRAEEYLVNFWNSLGLKRGGAVHHSVF